MDHQVKHYKEKKSYIWLYITLIFVGILLFLLYTSFYNPDITQTITGNIIRDNIVNRENAVIIDANLGVPGNLEVKSKMDKLSFRLTSPVNLIVGKQKIQLDDKSSVIIDNFDGELIINEKTINLLSGKGTKIFIDGLPIDEKSGSSFVIESQESFGYSFLELNEFFINSITYSTSGVVGINDNKIIVRLKEESFVLNDFEGDLEINRNTLKLRGYSDKSSAENLVDTTSFVG